jgi:hypothetical protein
MTSMARKTTTSVGILNLLFGMTLVFIINQTNQQRGTVSGFSASSSSSSTSLSTASRRRMFMEDERTSKSKISTLRQASVDSDFERPSTFMDNDGGDDDGMDINIVWLDDDDESKEVQQQTNGKKKRNNRAESDVRQKRWGKLNPKFERRNKFNNSKMQDRESQERQEKKRKDSPQDKKRRKSSTNWDLYSQSNLLRLIHSYSNFLFLHYEYLSIHTRYANVL